MVGYILCVLLGLAVGAVIWDVRGAVEMKNRLTMNIGRR